MGWQQVKPLYAASQMKCGSPNKCFYQGFFPRLRIKVCSANCALEGSFIWAAYAPLAPVSLPELGKMG